MLVGRTQRFDSARRAALVVGAALAAATTGCRACTTNNGETVFEKIDGPVKVEVVRQSSWGGSQLVPNVGFVLRVHATPAFDAQLPACLSLQYELGEDKGGALIAARCAMDGEWWQVIRLGHDTHVVDCPHELPPAHAADFTKVPPLADAATAIVACHEEGLALDRATMAEVYAALSDELREEGGATAVQTFLAQTSDRAISRGVDQDTEDPWMLAVTRLPAAEQAAIDATLCLALSDPAKTTAYVRAARRCPLDDPRVGNAAVDRFRAALAGSPPADSGKWATAVDWAAAIATKQRPADAGAAACEFLTRATPPVDDPRAELSLRAIAASKTSCQAVRSRLVEACTDWPMCDGGLCAAPAVGHALDGWLAMDDAKDDAGVRRRAPARPHVAAIVPALLANGPLPREATQRNARRGYEVDYGVGHDRCESTGALGAPCDCSTYLNLDANVACNLPLDGGSLVVGHCALRADDRARRVGFPVRECTSVDAGACESPDDCCSGVCRTFDGGHVGSCEGP